MWWTKLLNLFKVRWKAMLVLCGVAALVFFVWYGQSTLRDWGAAIAEREQLVQTVKQQNKQMDELLKEMEMMRKANKKRHEELMKIREDFKDIPYEINQIIEEKEKVSNWSYNRMPDAVYNRMRGQKSGDENASQIRNSTN